MSDLLLLGMVMYAKEIDTKKEKIKITWDKKKNNNNKKNTTSYTLQVQQPEILATALRSNLTSG